MLEKKFRTTKLLAEISERATQKSGAMAPAQLLSYVHWFVIYGHFFVLKESKKLFSV